ncbi:MAG: transketolase [Streptosporangiales bacterium]|nr:transketolase [Streptosporangiales bacterium]
MAADERVWCLDGDTGLFDADAFGPAKDRYVNLGIAEHNLIGTAAGMAASGLLPYVNTMAAFAATRALEAVKVDVAYNALPVRIAATHGGLAAGHLGPTHHALEDLAVMRALPGCTVVVPADADQAVRAVRQTADHPGPVYLRLGRGPTPPLASAVPEPGPEPFTVGRAQWLRRGPDVAIVACGPYPVLAALEAAEVLANLGATAAVLNLHTLAPLDADAVVEAAHGTAGVVTVEEHWRTGGLGGAVAEVLGERAPARIRRVGMPATFAEVAGGQRDLLERYGITGAAVAAAARELMEGTAWEGET